MVSNTNPDALDFDDWAAPALDSGEPRWKLRALAVAATHLDADTKAIT